MFWKVRQKQDAKKGLSRAKNLDWWFGAPGSDPRASQFSEMLHSDVYIGSPGSRKPLIMEWTGFKFQNLHQMAM